MARQWGIAICATIMLLVLAENRAQGQYAEPCRAPTPTGARGTIDSSVEGFVKLVPSLCVSERYDTNVFFTRSTTGLKREDYVTSVNPMLRVSHNGNYATGFVETGGVSETYVNNSGLNFLGSSGTFSANLDNTIKRILPNASLNVSDAVSYGPVPSGFVNPVAGTSPGAPGNPQDMFSRGILFSRTNRIANGGTVSAGYALSALMTVEASYNHSILRFLSSSPGFFDTTTQVGAVGATTRLSESNRLNIRYSFSYSEFSSGIGPSSLFKTHTATFGWSRVLTPTLTVETGGGGILIEPGRATYSATGAVIYDIVTTRATLSYARSAFPSYLGTATQVVGDVVSVSVSHQISPQWQLTGMGNYSRSSGAGGNNSIRFDSYGGALNLTYLVTRIWTMGLGYTYQRFDQEFSTVLNQFDRHVTMFSMRATWE